MGCHRFVECGPDYRRRYVHGLASHSCGAASAGLIDRAHTNVNKSVSVSDALNFAEEKWLAPLVEERTMDHHYYRRTNRCRSSGAGTGGHDGNRTLAKCGRTCRNGLAEFAARKRAGCMGWRRRKARSLPGLSRAASTTAVETR